MSTNNYNGASVGPVEPSDDVGDLVMEQGSAEVADQDLNVEDMVAEAGMSHVNRDLDIPTSWAVLPTSALYDEDDEGDIDKMIEQVPWFDRGALEAGGIVDKSAWNGWLSGGIRVEWREKW